MRTIFTYPEYRRGLFNLTLSIILLFSTAIATAQLSGEYGVGAGQVYATFNDACSDLELLGVSGPVIFNVSPGIYNEQFTIPYIPNATEDNTVTFQSSTGNSEDVVVQYESTLADENFVVKIKQANYLILKNISFIALGETYSRPVLFENYAFYVTLEGCRLKGHYDTNARAQTALIFATGTAFNYLNIINNSFSEGSYGIYLNSSTQYNLYSNISSNSFDSLGYCAINLVKHEYSIIEKNIIFGAGYGIRLSNSSSGIHISSNKLDNIRYTGLYLTGMTSAPGFESEVVNNSVYVLSFVKSGVEVRSCSYVNFYNNTVVINAPFNSNASAFYLIYCINHTINLLNNNLVALASGYTLYSATADQIDNCDYNNYYTRASQFAFWGEDCEDFRMLKNLSGKNEHSIFAWPNFNSLTEPVPNSAWLDGAGTPLSSVSTDIDETVRDESHPDIGAWEFSAGPETKPAMSGTYTIGSGGDYLGLNNAIDDLNVKGISDTVRLQFLPAYHEEQCLIPPITGASSEKPLIIESSTQNRDDVHLWYNADDSEDNYVLYLQGASFVLLKDLSLHAMDSRWGRILNLEGLIDSLYVQNCTFHGNGQTDASASGILVMANDINFHFMLIENDSLLNGTSAIMMNNNKYNSAPGEFHMLSNYFENGYQNLYARQVHSMFIKENHLLSNTYGLNIDNVDIDLEILNNYVYSKYGQGLDITYASFENFTSGTVANNFFMTDYSNANKSQLSLYNCDHLNLYFNSFSMLSNNSGDVPCNIQNSEAIRLKNNIFYNSGTAYSFYTKNAEFLSADYNCFYSAGTSLAYWNSACTNLEAIKTASTSNVNSIMANPGFLSFTDLHSNSSFLDGAGLPVAGIDTDIDGDVRDELNPDIGADEFGIIPNRAPMVENPIPDQQFEWNTGPHEIAMLDTVFSDPDSDELSYTAVSTENWLLPVVEDNILRLAVGEGASGTSMVIVTATDPSDASTADTFTAEYYIPVNHPPVATDDTVFTADALQIMVLENDYDEDGDNFLVAGLEYHGSGFANINNDNTAIHYNIGNINDQKDTITYWIEDEHGERDTARVFISFYLVMEGFYETEMDLAGLSHGSVRWGDYDDDGNLDLLQTGWTGTLMNYETRIITNTGDGFEPSGISLTGLSAGTAASAEWIDFDNDNDLDIVVTGRLNGDEYTKKSILYENIGANFYPVDPSGLVGVTSSFLSPADVNHDGMNDILVSGSGEDGDFTLIHMNSGSGFASVDTDLPGIHDGVACQVDLDMDGETDIFICGVNISPSRVYLSGPDAYEEFETIVPGMYNASADFADMDADGDMDLAIMGTDGDNNYLRIYENVMNLDYGDIFSLYSEFAGVESGELAWADYDNDGDMDLAVTGNESLFKQVTFILRNTGENFDKYNYNMKGLGRSSLDWGDYDGDGDLDLVVQGTGSTGPHTLIYRYDTEIPNMAPIVSDNLRTSFADPYYVLSWDPASDDKSPVETLTYNIRIGTSSGGTDILSPASVSNFMKSPVPGNAGNNISMKILLPGEGTFFWSVQSVDQGFNASAFSAEAMLEITGIEEQGRKEKFAVYPNPAGERIWIHCPSERSYHLQIIDIAGRVNMEKDFTSTGQPAEIKISELERGSYIVMIKDDTGSGWWSGFIVKD